jgi:large subunit ribosomal protein L10
MRQEKQLLLDEIAGQIKQSGNTFVIMSYQKLNANAANEFRRQIAKLGGNLEVVRKRVLLKAAQTAGIDLKMDVLPGHIGLVYGGNDPIETTKAVFRFSEENEQTIKVVGGHFEGQLYTGEQIEALSKLPGKNEMRAQLLGLFEAPMAQTLSVMEALLASVMYCLDNKAKQESPNN